MRHRLIQGGQYGKTRASGLGDQLRIAISHTAEHRWVVPILVMLGFAASLAESLGISLAILLLYALVGGDIRAEAVGNLIASLYALADQVTGGDRVTLALLIFGLIVSKALINLAYSLLTTRMSNIIAEETRNAIYRQYMEVSYGFLRNHDQGHLITVLATESWTICEAFHCLTRLIINACAILVFGAFLVAISWPIFLAAAVCSLVVGVMLGRIAAPVRRLGADAVEANRVLTIRMVNTLQSMRTIRAFAAEGQIEALYRAASARVRETFIRLGRIQSVIGPVNEVAYLVLLGCVALVATLLSTPVASALGAVALLYRLQPHIRETDGHRVKLAGLAASLATVEEMLRRDDKDYPASGDVPFTRLSSEIRLENVSVTYPGADSPSLEDATFSIPAGKRTAILGASGAGKTTVINLLLGLLEPSAGRIIVDGTPFERIDRRGWLRRVAVAGQDAELMEGTIRENIMLGLDRVTEAELEDAARRAGIHDFIRALPQGYDTWIGERGLNVSGGQRQRIGLARAFVRRPEILILDEATNALDRALEEHIHEGTDELMAGKTVIVISHHADTTAGADHFVVIEEGRVVREEASSHVGLRASGRR